MGTRDHAEGSYPFAGDVAYVARPGVERVNDHASEDLAGSAFVTWWPDYLLDNDGTLEQLAGEVERLLLPAEDEDER